LTLRNLSRADIESVTGHVKDVSENAILMRCLDDYYIWGLKSDVSLTPNIMMSGYWEGWITSWFSHNIKEGDYVLDIGANCGYFTMLFERLVGPDGIVDAYEANPEYVDLLERTRIENDARFSVTPYAVSDRIGTATLTFPGDYTGSASITLDSFDGKYGDEKKITVQTTSLNFDFEYATLTPDLVKMDVEGAEELVWRGGSNLWHAEKAPVLVIEYTPGAYTQKFNDEIFEYGIVTRIGYDGKEESVSKEELDNLTDWAMLVIRRR
jgi:FkbM family methyltransferase